MSAVPSLLTPYTPLLTSSPSSSIDGADCNSITMRVDAVAHKSLAEAIEEINIRLTTITKDLKDLNAIKEMDNKSIRERVREVARLASVLAIMTMLGGVAAVALNPESSTPVYITGGAAGVGLISLGIVCCLFSDNSPLKERIKALSEERIILQRCKDEDIFLRCACAFYTAHTAQIDQVPAFLDFLQNSQNQQAIDEEVKKIKQAAYEKALKETKAYYSLTETV